MKKQNCRVNAVTLTVCSIKTDELDPNWVSNAIATWSLLYRPIRISTVSGREFIFFSCPGVRASLNLKRLVLK